MFQLQVNNCTYLNDDKTNFNYELDTDIGKISLQISHFDELKKTLIEFTNCPFYIITEKNIKNTIKPSDYFEIASSQTTINLECTASCGINYHI